MRRTDQQYATRLRSRGWVVVDPADLDTVVAKFRELADDGPARDPGQPPACPDHREQGNSLACSWCGEERAAFYRGVVDTDG